MLTEVGLIVLGIPLGFMLRKNRTAVRTVDRLTMWAIYGLLFLLGVSLGADDSLVSRLDDIGLRAAIISLCCVLGSAAAAWFLDRVVLRGKLDER